MASGRLVVGAAKTVGAHSHTFQIRQHDAASVADDHVLDVAVAIDEHADLTMNLLEQGYKVIYEDRALAFTEAPATAGGSSPRRSGRVATSKPVP